MASVGTRALPRCGQARDTDECWIPSPEAEVKTEGMPEHATRGQSRGVHKLEEGREAHGQAFGRCHPSRGCRRRSLRSRCKPLRHPAHRYRCRLLHTHTHTTFSHTVACIDRRAAACGRAFTTARPSWHDRLRAGSSVHAGDRRANRSEVGGRTRRISVCTAAASTAARRSAGEGAGDEWSIALRFICTAPALKARFPCPPVTFQRTAKCPCAVTHSKTTPGRQGATALPRTACKIKARPVGAYQGKAHGRCCHIQRRGQRRWAQSAPRRVGPQCRRVHRRCPRTAAASGRHTLQRTGAFRHDNITASTVPVHSGTRQSWQTTQGAQKPDSELSQAAVRKGDAKHSNAAVAAAIMITHRLGQQNR